MSPSTQYVSISRRALDVEDYIDIVRRHTSWILGPLFAGLVISCVAAFLLPNTYVSRAVMRISPAQISNEMVPSTVSQQMNERIGQMQQDILSRDSLSELIQRPALNLYRRERDKQPLQDVIEVMRARDIKINIFSPAGGGRPASAFEIAYAYPDRVKAQAVVQVLIQKFMDAMENAQRSNGKVTTDFLTREVAQAKAEIDRLDTEITNFRVQNAGHLPEELQVNLQALNGLQQQMTGVNDALGRLSEEKLTLETNLQTLKMQHDTYSSIASATQEGSAAKIQSDRLSALNREIADYESQLQQMREIYTETYPNIRNAKNQLAFKKKQRDQLQLLEDEEALKPKAATAKKATSPMVQERLNDIQGGIDMVNTQLRNKESERLGRLKQLDEINKAMATYQSRVSQVPANQQKYVALIREHELASANYQSLERRQAAAATYEHVNKGKVGENLEVLDNASLPEVPTAPNRSMITGIGVGMGLMLGVFLTGVKEMKDASLKNLKDVRAYTNLPILSSIPLLENDLLVRRKRRLTYVGWAASIILGIVAMSGSMYYHYFLSGA
ncbi:MAG: hypothetical protein M3Z09_09660 [Acidobacteriota bacterium]|nr:hypothetical protein [Acidobacteriota bacterium]